MNAALKERLFVAFASHCANEGRAWALVDIVLAELAGELRDCERYRWLRDADHGWYVGPEHSTYNDAIVDGEYLNHGVEGLDAAIDEARHG